MGQHARISSSAGFHEQSRFYIRLPDNIVKITKLLAQALVLLVTIGTNLCLAQPTISSTSGDFYHKGVIRIEGSDFGVKSPAAPLMWDDGEHGLSIPAKGWCDAVPKSASSQYNLAYRSGPFRDMSNPHGRGSKFLAGGHEDNRPYGSTNGNSVGMTVSLGSTPSKLYYTYYGGFDPRMPTSTTSTSFFYNNVKYDVYEASCSYYSRLAYSVFANDKNPLIGGDNTLGSAGPTSYVGNINVSRCQTQGGSWCYSRSDFNGVWSRWESVIDVGPGGSFQTHVMAPGRSYNGSRYFEASGTDLTYGGAGLPALSLGGYLCYQSAVTTIQYSDFIGPNARGEYYATLSSDAILGLKAQSYSVFSWLVKGTVGSLSAGQWGYDAANHRVYIKDAPDSNYTYNFGDSMCGSPSSAASHGGHADAWRYFDDVYVDTTWARVLLANTPDFQNATIVEPQIPSAWSGSSITCSVNAGRLANGSVDYLFVFDANNAHNASGYPVVIGGAEGSPATPTGLRVVPGS